VLLCSYHANKRSFDCSSYGGDSGYTCEDNSTQAQFAVEQNKRYRLRFINTGAFGEFQISVDNHSLSVIEVDSTQVQPTTIQRLAIHIAQRYSVILTANQTVGNYWIRAQMNTFCFSGPNPVLDPDIRAILSYTNTSTTPKDAISVDWSSAPDLACEDLNDTTLIPSVVSAPPPATTMYVVTFSFQIGAYTLDRAYINSTSWVGTPQNPTLNQAVAGLHAANSSFRTAGLSTAFGASQFVIAAPDAAVVDLLIYSLDEGAHPFHLHGHQFWILQTGAGDFDWAAYGAGRLDVANPIRRDTMTVDAYAWSLIRFVVDNPGLWALHCHISWHMEAGLLMQFQARDDIMSGWTIPPDVLGLCQAGT
jgi:FtsP/CotA-like multicopper oxidase with cupredoxin domain